MFLALLSPTTSAQQPAAPRPGLDFAAIDAPTALASTAFAEFSSTYGGTWWTRWCAATDTPLEVFGSGLAIADWRGANLDEARRHARAVITTHGALLGTLDDEFREAIAAEFGNVFSFTFEQYHGGLPVIGGRADVRINKCGRIAFLGSQALRVPGSLQLVPTLDELAAESRAWIALGKPRQLPIGGPPRTPRLVLYGDLESKALAEVFLCWEVPVDSVDADGRGPIGRYFVDAHTGVIRHYRNDKHECGLAGCSRHDRHRHATPTAPATAITPTTVTVLGFARDGNSCITPPTLVPMPGLEVAVPGIGTVVTDLNGQFTVDLTAPTSITIALDGIHHRPIVGGSAPTANATLQPGQAQTIQLLTPGATASELAHTTCSLWVHRLNEWARSILGNSSQLASADNVLPTVNAAQTCNAFYSNNGITFFADGGGCNNTASSSVVAHEWGHGLDDRYGGISQTHGLSEGWGDICSEYLLDDPIVAADFFTSGASLRTGLNTRQYPPPGEVHDAGEVWMGFAWLFRQNLRTIHGTAAARLISDTTVIGSIAANALDQPSAVTQVFIADDNDGNLINGTPHYDQLEPACLAHNLPYPVRQLATITLPALADTTLQLEPRFLTATVVPTSGTIQQVQLVYNDGAPHTLTMLPTGTANEYRALLPGLPAPTTVAWHVDVFHSQGVTLRSPQTTDRTYDVYALTPFWNEDFETGAPGWTHSATYGTDDWEIGAPQGRSGSGWADPSTAASGVACAGTDLTGDGAHSASSEYRLRSPTINCTGKQGVRLRFKRWITIDAITRDLAIMRVNTSTAWLNLTTPVGPVVDTGWVQQELRIPAADNNPNVVLEWYLRTDGTNNFGGWNIDDVELWTSSVGVPLPQRLRVQPAMVAQGNPITLDVHTQVPTMPFLIVAGDTAGPTAIPGLPTLLVGGNAFSLGGTTNGTGDAVMALTAPLGVAATGLVIYSQMLTLDANLQIVASNPWTNLFTP